MIEYDKIAKEYEDYGKNIVKRVYSTDPSFMNVLGDLKGKSVLDLGCGDGHFTRKIKIARADEVIGVDISKEMIRLAKEIEAQNPFGIKYFVEDVIKLDKIGEFDVVCAGLLLHYSKTKEELLKMCTNIYKNLKQGGRFVTINQNPSHLKSDDKKYGNTLIPEKEDIKEGGKLIVTIYDKNKEICSFINYHWKKETYEWALKKAGFKEIKWIDLEVSEEGIKKFGRDFWKEYLESPTLIIIEAKKY